VIGSDDREEVALRGRGRAVAERRDGQRRIREHTRSERASYVRGAIRRSVVSDDAFGDEWWGSVGCDRA
jgi:hypothetical protein